MAGIGGGGMNDAFPQPGALGQQPTAEEVLRQLATQVGALTTEMQQMRTLQQQNIGNVDAANVLAAQVHDIHQSVTGMQSRMDNVEQAAAAAISASAHNTPRGDVNAGSGAAGLNLGNPQQGPVQLDVRNIGKPELLTKQEEWSNFGVVFRSFMGALFPNAVELMNAAEQTDNAFHLNEQELALSKQLYHTLVMQCRNEPLTIVVNAGGATSDGLLAWRALVRRYEPRIRSRHTGQLMHILSFDLGDNNQVMARLGDFERLVHLYERDSSEKVSDSTKIGVVMRNLKDTGLRTHLTYHSDRLASWMDFRREINNILSAQMASSSTSGPHLSTGSGVAPMQIGALGAGGKSAGKGDGKN